MLRLQNAILELVATGAELGFVCAHLCEAIERMLPDITCSLVRVDSMRALRTLAAPSLSCDFSAVVDGTPIGPECGACGSAIFHGASVAIADIATDPRMANHRHLLIPLGYAACWSSPINDSNGKTLGAFAFYFRQSRTPTAFERQIVETCVNLCAIAIERHDRVTERERLANTDALTELGNRASFNKVLKALPCDRPGNWALLVVDLDNLKITNDTFGHHAGDDLLRVVAARIDAAVRPDRAFRIGGDEFAIIVEHPDHLQRLDDLAESILMRLAEPALCSGHLIKPTATIGGAILEPNDLSAETVRKHADFALYHAKATGRGGFVRYWPGIGTAITDRLSVIRDVQYALQDDRLDAYYQPIVDLRTRRIIGLEALCRMTTTSGAVLPAAAFCEATEDAHVATSLTHRMLSRVAADIRAWLDQGIEFGYVGVNVASADFRLGRIREQLNDIFAMADVSLDHLVIEVNEDVYMGQRDQIVAQEIKAMRARGLHVALDDFGTGFASLTHLLTMPVDTIKIDRSFIEMLEPGSGSGAIIEGVIRIADRLRIDVVAEGVETEEQARILEEFGCAMGQGYLFSRAVDRHETTRLLRADGALQSTLAHKRRA